VRSPPHERLEADEKRQSAFTQGCHHGTAHRLETRRKPRAFRGTDAKEFPILSGAKEFPILSPKCASLRMFMVENLARVSASPASDAILTSARKRSPLCSGGG